MATNTGKDNKNVIKVSNNQARYYSELAEDYKNQANGYATAAATSATLAGEYYTSTQAMYTEALTGIADATTTSLETILSTTTVGLSSINTAQTSALNTINADTTEALTLISSSAAEGATSIRTETTIGLNNINTLAAEATSNIQEVGTSVVNETTTAVAGLTETSLNSLSAAKTDVLNTISGAKTEALATIESEKTNALSSINTTAGNNINTMNALKGDTLSASENSHIWAEGSDSDVQALGGEHSAKEWCRYNSTVNQNDVRVLQGALTPWEVYSQGDSDSINSRLEEVIKYAHSTFDLSKFTVEGSPTITDDGIVSGFSSSSYINGATGIILGNNFEITVKFATGSNVTDYQGIFRLQSGTTFIGALTSYTGQDRLTANFSDGVNHMEHPVIPSMTTNTTYYVKLKLVNGVCTYSYSTDNINWTDTYSGVSSVNITNANTVLYIGNNTTSLFWSGSIDLKQFSITVDGVEVFSGNKTGIDTIKPDDYTVEGSPAISADGVMTITTGQAVYKELAINAGAKTVIEFDYTGYINSSSVQLLYIAYPSENNTELTWVYVGLSGEVCGVRNSSTNIMTEGQKYHFRIETDFSTYQSVYVDDDLWMTEELNNSTDVGKIYFANRADKIRPVVTPFDLNTFKIYVEGNFVYQPCLKIPYTEGVNNNKVVDVAYRDRVNDLFEQVGYNGYYTLDEENGTFTLPTHKFSDVIDCYENGLNKWEQRVDRTVRQQGSCTSGTEVTLLKPYADTNYALSVPYSAKSATAFTPTQTGEWFAEGKVAL